MNIESIILVENLNFGYNKNQLTLQHLNLAVPKASVYGFLGANGAGKSTTIRAILGLLRPQSGKIKLFEKDIKSQRLAVLSKIGTLIESPSLYKHLSGYDNLKIVCKYLNIPTSRIDEVLELVNLTANAHKISKKYSTGMKQRLGLAMALLPDPELLILDEPTNGLDPTGIREIRNILQNLNQQGKTIFLSSHLLSEIEKIATQVGIIKGGTMIFQGTIQELEALKMNNLRVNVVTQDATKAIEVLNGKYKTNITEATQFEILLEDRENLPHIIETFVNKGIKLYEVSAQKNDLEKLFINLTEN
ncbi:MAG: ATP-binding cassette domain-containing protein [Saprospiraceae bacterium]|nr:ATP-binding cassette domain-containing protein [Saprospiraceae bacterium]